MEVIWQSELDAKASAVLDHHWPAVKNLGDIHGIGKPPAVDVLVGGFPCQSYSVAGKRGGLADDRGALWWEYHRLIAELRPSWVVGENVPGLLSSRGGEDFQTIIGSLTQLGYGVAWAVLDAQYFGVAQRRRRVFIVGHSGGQPRPEILAFAEGLCGNPPPSRKTGERTAPTLAARTRGGGWPGSDEAIDGALAFNWQATGDWVNPRTGYTDALHAGQTPAVAFAQNTRDEVRDLNDLAGAIAAEPGMKQTTYVTRPSVRRLTPLECERLQGFPAGWTDIPGNSDTQRYRQLGNAVAVPVAEWLMRKIANAA